MEIIMKKLCSLIAAFALAASLLAGCGASGGGATAESAEAGTASAETEAAEAPAEDTPVRVMALKGPTAMGMVQLMDSSEAGAVNGNAYTFTIAASAD